MIKLVNFDLFLGSKLLECFEKDMSRKPYGDGHILDHRGSLELNIARRAVRSDGNRGNHRHGVLDVMDVHHKHIIEVQEVLVDSWRLRAEPADVIVGRSAEAIVNC